MYPSRFRYEAPGSLDEAIALLQQRRRRGQGAGRRPEPGAADEAALRRARDARRHQRPARPRLPPRRTPTAPSTSARCAGTPRSSAPTMLPGQPAHDGRRGAADRRPDRAQPGHAGRLAVPRRPAGRLGGGGDGPRRPRGRAGAGRAAHDRLSDFVTGPFQNILAYDEMAVEAVDPGAHGCPPAATSSSSAGSATSPPPGWPSRSSTPGRPGRPGRDRPDRRRRLHHRRPRRRRGARRTAARRRDAIARAAELAAEAARPRTDHRGSADVQAAHRAHVRHADPDPHLHHRGGRLHDQPVRRGRRAGRRRTSRYVASPSPSTAASAPPTSSRGCCSRTCSARGCG